MQAAKEKASNAAASAKAGMEKTKATLQEKGERMTTRDPLRKDLATERKDERITEAELEKQRAREYNAAQKQAGGTGGFSTGHTGHGGGTTGQTGYGGTTTGGPDYGGTTGYGATAMDAPGHGGGAAGDTGYGAVGDPGHVRGNEAGSGGVFSTTGYRATDPSHRTGEF